MNRLLLRYVKNRAPVFALLLGLGILLVSCAQDPIFHTIFLEEEPRDPTVPGSPYNMVEYTDGGVTKMLVANGKSIYAYYGGSWGYFSSPPGRPRHLAVTSNNELYAQTLGNDITDSAVWKYDGAGAWTLLPKPVNFDSVQAVYAADSKVFFYARNSRANTSGADTYGFYHYDAGSIPEFLGNGILYGAAWDGTNYYLAVGSSIIKFDGSSTTVVQSFGGLVKGIISLGGFNAGYVVAVTSGTILTTSSGFSSFSESLAYELNGALAFYCNAPPFDPAATTPDFLLLGRDGTNGYTEWASNPLMGAGTTFINYERYSITLGDENVRFLHQFSGDGTLFASTLNNGLWVQDATGNWHADDR